MATFQTLLAELRRRRVIRALLVWGLVAFAVLQVFEPIMHGLHLPEWTLSFVVVLLGLGFPVTLALSWMFDLTAGGVERTPAAPAGQLAGGQRALLLVGLGLLAALPGFGWYLLRGGPPAKPPVETTQTATASPAPPGAISAPSIAVLPFADMSPGHDQEYFADGVAEEILNALAHVEGLRVPGRVSSFWFKGKDADLAEIGRKLNVTHVLEGSVRRAGSRLRVTAQVIGVADGYHLWSETFDRPEADVFAVQDQVARAVVEALKLRLLARQSAARAARPTSAEVYDLELLGRNYLRRAGTEFNVRHAAEAYQKALALDDRHAPAWAGLAKALNGIADFEPTLDKLVACQQQAMVAAERAIALDPTLAEGWLARAIIRQVLTYDVSGAEADINQALALSPNGAEALTGRGQLFSNLGRLQEALVQLQRATALDPLSGDAWITVGVTRLKLGDLAGARADLERARQLIPDGVQVWFNLGLLALLEGRPTEAAAAFERSPEEFWRLTGLALAGRGAGREAEARAALATLTGRFGHVSAYQVAEIHAWWGEPDQALDWLERAYRQNDGGLSQLKSDVLLRPLHGQPRFTALLRKVHLPVE